MGELQTKSKTSLTIKEEYFLLSEHSRQLEVLENLDNSSSSVIGTVVTYQNMYSAYIRSLKDVPAIRKRIAELEEDFGGEFDSLGVLEEGKQLLAKRSLDTLRTKIEMLHFSVLKTTAAISRLAGMYIAIVRIVCIVLF